MMFNLPSITLLTLLLFFNTLSIAKNNNQYSLTNENYKALVTAQELISKEQYSKAEVKLLALLKRTNAGSYDEAMVRQILGYTYSSQEQYQKAITEFEQALASKVLSETVSHALRYNLGQLLLIEEEYSKGVEMLEQWFNDEPSPSNAAHALIASGYYPLYNYSKTVKHMKIAIRNKKSAPENWYQLLLAGHIELKQYSASIELVELMIVRYPHKEPYWQQLAFLYAQQNKEVSALATQVLADRLELSDGDVLLRVSSLYRYLNIPYKSAQLLVIGLQKGVVIDNEKNLSFLANSWLAAREREKAAAVLKRLAEKDSTGESDLKYGRVLFDLEEWQASSEAFDNSLQKLKGAKRGRANLMVGLTQFQLGRLKQAELYLKKATDYKSEEKQALHWLNYLELVMESKSVEQRAGS
jgi:tetratricopeptide (TPR) repeat protein